ncbi:sugar ABC transporter ATP-binding protein [bacterium]|nr:sugar ABC transporter ATP-binding protein [bacterium]
MAVSKPSAAELLRLESITKDFPGARALDSVSLSLCSGEVLALMGENGAGKSTLMKVLSGVWPSGSFEGRVVIDGKECSFSNTHDAHSAGIAMIHQELALFPELTVAEHLVLDQLPSLISWRPILEKCQEFLDRLGFGLKADAKVKQLSIGNRQLVEIARALYRDARILVFDEPTSALSETEVVRLYQIIRDLKSQGHGILYITHRMDEVFELADRLVVLRDGKNAAEFSRLDSSGAPRRREELEPLLLKAMVGREIKDVFPAKEKPTDRVVFEVSNLSLFRPNGKQRLHDISFQVRAGEVLGLAGLLGSGRSEIFETLFGQFHPDGPKGPGYRVQANVRIDGNSVSVTRPADALRAGLAFLSEDRKGNGLMLGQAILQNISLAQSAKLRASLLKRLNSAVEMKSASKWISDLRVRCVGPEQAVGQLSGGNQQKVVLAKWLETAPKVLFLDEPTRGVDIGAKAEIYQWIQGLAQQGMAIIVVSSELPELLGVSHRILVLREGRISAELDASEANQEKIMGAASL